MCVWCVQLFKFFMITSRRWYWDWGIQKYSFQSCFANLYRYICYINVYILFCFNFGYRNYWVRVITVEYAKRFKRPSPPATAGPPGGETHHKLYVSNLAWKARSTNLRELFTTTNFNPVSTRVVFESSSGKSAGYSFVSFATKEEAENAISALNGKVHQYNSKSCLGFFTFVIFSSILILCLSQIKSRLFPFGMPWRVWILFHYITLQVRNLKKKV